MTRYARAERAALADSLAEAGPDAPTLCEGWATRDLAAHLVLREQKPLAAPGILIKPLAGVTERIQRRLADGDYASLVGKVRDVPWWSPMKLGAVEEGANLVEFLVHHEDVRRAVPGWRPRQLSRGYEEALFGRAKATARLSARRFPGTIAASAPGFGEFTAGRGQGGRVEVTGAPAELVLFFVGRQAVAEVEVSGPDELVAKVKRARFGI